LSRTLLIPSLQAVDQRLNGTLIPQVAQRFGG
jgi:hypothetical protein